MDTECFSGALSEQVGLGLAITVCDSVLLRVHVVVGNDAVVPLLVAVPPVHSTQQSVYS